MSSIEGSCRTPRLLLPDVLDDYVTEENPVRFIDADVERLDLERLGFARAQAALTGRPGYDPRDVLKLSSYGDFNRVRSSRRLARETHRHVELIWLLRKLRPDVKTIADFRKHNTTALHVLFREFVLLGKQWDLLGAARLAIDGSKFKAVNSTHKNFTKAKLETALKDVDAPVEQYVRALDAADRAESSVHQPTSEELQQKIERLQERQQRYHGFVQGMTARGESQLSLTDPESRSMPKSPKVDVGYNVQIAVDSQHTLRVEQEVTHAVTDDDQLRPMAMRAKETLGVERMKAVAAMGYSHGHEIKTWEEAGIEAYVPKPSTSAHTTRGLFGKERFSYDPQKDGDWCPGGEALTCRFATTELGRPMRYSATAACRRCPLKDPCTRHTAGRRIPRWVDEHLLERREERLKAPPELMQERTQLVEHPFGTIKPAHDQGYVLMKGRKHVRAEFSLSCLADNLKRVSNILGVPRLLVALG